MIRTIEGLSCDEIDLGRQSLLSWYVQPRQHAGIRARAIAEEIGVDPNWMESLFEPNY